MNIYGVICGFGKVIPISWPVRTPVVCTVAIHAFDVL